MKREENSKEDLIRRADAFKALQIKGDYNTLNEVYEKLEKLPSVKPVKNKREWIAVTDRLPDAADTYIVTIEYKGKFVGVDAAEYVFTGDGYIDGEWNTWNDWIEGPNPFYHVTAWRPLPEPYKDEMEV